MGGGGVDAPADGGGGVPDDGGGGGLAPADSIQVETRSI